MSGLSKEQIDDLLDSVLSVKKRMSWKNTKIQFTCPIHDEDNPSCGINLDFQPPDTIGESYQVFHCFSCGAGGSIPWLVYKSLPDQFKNTKEAENFLRERYGVSFMSFSEGEVIIAKKYDDFFIDLKEERFELPKSKIAPFKSGKETYRYFFDRGFDKEDMRKFMIGRDIDNETITIPAFWEDGVLAGVIGRYIDPKRPKNMRFKIYEFPKGSLIYPLDKLEVVNDTIIGVEAMFDVMMLHKWGYPNSVAMMGDGMSKEQSDMIASKCRVFIDLFDNDKGGLIARKIAKKRLGKRVLYLTPSYYPETGKDPSDWGELETIKVIESASIGGGFIPKL